MEPQGLGDLRADWDHRVEGAERVLKDHRDGAAAQPAHGAARQAQKLAPAEADRARDARRGRQQAQNRLQRDALARAALADDAQDLARIHVEVDAAHRLDPAAEGDAQVADPEEGGLGHVVWGSRRSRSPSPRKLKPSTTVRIAMPGPNAIHQL